MLESKSNKLQKHLSKASLLQSYVFGFKQTTRTVQTIEERNRHVMENINNESEMVRGAKMINTLSVCGALIRNACF